MRWDSGRESVPARGAESCRVKPGVLETLSVEPLEIRRVARPTKCRAGTEADIVDEDDQYVWSAFRGTHRFDRWELVSGSLAS